MLLSSAAAIFACTGDEQTPAPPPIDYDALLRPPEGGVDAHATRPSINIDGWPVVDPGAASPKPVMQAIATLQAIGNSKPIGDKAFGSVRFAATSEGARVTVDLGGSLTFLDKYTLRVHLSGDCSAADGASAGPGYNFGGSSLDQPDPRFVRGYLAEVEVDVSGGAKKEESVRGAAIQGPYSIVGRSVVVHAKPTSPSSEGARIACGVIGMVADAPPR
jgi:superoxide dismutase, Cu-Zn family